MGASGKILRLLPPHIRSRKGSGDPIVCLTAYSAVIAKLLDPHCDLVLVGDSLGMVLYGMDSTLPVRLKTMIRHGKAVADNAEHACVVVDMPFGSYQECPEQAFRNCAKVLSETRCSAVKLEGGAEMAETIKFLVLRGVPVMAHIGLTPQYFNSLGGFKVQGKSEEDAEKILNDAKAVSTAGAFAVVLEGITEPLAIKITDEIEIPTIGIGASSYCDGQILVSDDMLGLTPEPHAKFVKCFANLSGEISKAAELYASEVKARSFPDAKHVYSGKKAAK